MLELELARIPGLQARVAHQAPHLLGLSPTRYFQLLGRLLDRPKPPTPNRAGHPAADGAGPTPPTAPESVVTEPG